MAVVVQATVVQEVPVVEPMEVQVVLRTATVLNGVAKVVESRAVIILRFLVVLEEDTFEFLLTQSTLTVVFKPTVASVTQAVKHLLELDQVVPAAAEAQVGLFSSKPTPSL